jgi:hypothetical protein
MMYSDKFVVAIKSGGKILKEAKDLVHLPFGSEFSVLVKNLNSRRAKFTLHIDGQDVLDGENIIVNANSEVEMKRFIRNGNMNEGNAFKFIERTQAIEDGPRGIKMDDGVVRVEFWFEQEAPEIKVTHHHDYWWDDYYYPRYRRTFWSPPFGGPYYGSITSTAGDLSNVKLGSASVKSANVRSAADSTDGVFAQAMNATSTFSSNSVSGESMAAYNSATMDSFSTETAAPAEVTVTNDVGITVPGSKVEQKFHTVYGFNSESQSHVIVIRLAGRAGAINIVAPVVARAKQKCTTCGHVNKANAKFCSECGTGLELV